jgi:[protein-PII] uridylyltransferase
VEGAAPARPDGFLLPRILRPRNERVFEEDPERLIRVFRHAQQTGAQIDIELQSLINTSRHLIDSRVINSPTANRAFLAILQEGGNVYPTLSLMNACGILRRFVPEFRGLHCLVQHEYYHRYTADIHTLNTIQELDQVFSSNDDPNLAEYRRVLRDTSSPALPYLALLLHDVGKADGIQGHAERGATMAREALARMKVNPEQSDKILVIIERHLDMAVFGNAMTSKFRSPLAYSPKSYPMTKLSAFYSCHLLRCPRHATGLWYSYKYLTPNPALYRPLIAVSRAIDLLLHRDMIPKDTYGRSCRAFRRGDRGALQPASRALFHLQ